MNAKELLRKGGKTEISGWRFADNGYTLVCDVTKSGVTKTIEVKLMDQMGSAGELEVLLQKKLAEAFDA
jgi:hypothetical protein